MKISKESKIYKFIYKYHPSILFTDITFSSLVYSTITLVLTMIFIGTMLSLLATIPLFHLIMLLYTGTFIVKGAGIALLITCCVFWILVAGCYIYHKLPTIKVEFE